MSPRRAKRRRSGLEPGINLTPMLDMVFNLLFFFVLATQIRSNVRQMEVKLPEAASAVAAEEKKMPPVVTLDAEGNIYFNEQPVIEEELALHLHSLAGKGEKEVTIHGDRQVDLGRAIKIMDLCREAGVTGVFLDAMAPGEN